MKKAATLTRNGSPQRLTFRSFPTRSTFVSLWAHISFGTVFSLDSHITSSTFLSWSTRFANVERGGSERKQHCNAHKTCYNLFHSLHGLASKADLSITLSRPCQLCGHPVDNPAGCQATVEAHLKMLIESEILTKQMMEQAEQMKPKDSTDYWSEFDPKLLDI